MQNLSVPVRTWMRKNVCRPQANNVGKCQCQYECEREHKVLHMWNFVIAIKRENFVGLQRSPSPLLTAIPEEHACIHWRHNCQGDSWTTGESPASCHAGTLPNYLVPSFSEHSCIPTAINRHRFTPTRPRVHSPPTWLPPCRHGHLRVVADGAVGATSTASLTSVAAAYVGQLWWPSSSANQIAACHRCVCRRQFQELGAETTPFW